MKKRKKEKFIFHGDGIVMVFAFFIFENNINKSYYFHVDFVLLVNLFLFLNDIEFISDKILETIFTIFIGRRISG